MQFLFRSLEEKLFRQLSKSIQVVRLEDIATVDLHVVFDIFWHSSSMGIHHHIR